MADSTENNSSYRLSFMVPVVLFVLFFAACCGVIATVFLRAAAETERAEQYSAAVQLCRNQAEICRSRAFPEADDLQTLYFGTDFAPASPEDGICYLTIAQELTETESGLLCKNTITAHTMDGAELYCLEVLRYLPDGGEAAA